VLKKLKPKEDVKPTEKIEERSEVKKDTDKEDIKPEKKSQC